MNIQIVEELEILKMRWETRWKFTRRNAFDGNFSVEQLKMKHLENDVLLSDNAFLITGASYGGNLKVAKELKEVSDQFMLKSWLTIQLETHLHSV